MWIPQVWVFLPQFLAEELASLAPQHAFRFTVDEPRDRRMLITWLSYRDLTELVRCCLFASRLGYTIVYGMSANRDQWWDNSKAAHLGFVAQDSSEPFRAKVERRLR